MLLMKMQKKPQNLTFRFTLLWYRIMRKGSLVFILFCSSVKLSSILFLSVLKFPRIEYGFERKNREGFDPMFFKICSTGKKKGFGACPRQNKNQSIEVPQAMTLSHNVTCIM